MTLLLGSYLGSWKKLICSRKNIYYFYLTSRLLFLNYIEIYLRYTIVLFNSVLPTELMDCCLTLSPLSSRCRGEDFP